MSERFCVAALFAPLEAGFRFARAEWPAHVTLVSNFVVGEPAGRVVAELTDAGWSARPLAFECGERALFGARSDIPVVLMASTDAARLHRDLATGLRDVNGFAADEPAHWFEGYRPHLTLRPGWDVAEGETRTATHVALVRLDGSAAEVTSCVEIRTAPPASR